MNKKIEIEIAICLSFLIMPILAETIIAGNCYNVSLSNIEGTNLTYKVTGNSNNLDGLSIMINGTEAKICTLLNFAPDSFKIEFYSQTRIEKVIEQTNTSGEPILVNKISSSAENITVSIIETPLEEVTINQLQVMNITVDKEGTGEIYFNVNKTLVSNRDNIFLYVLENETWTKLDTYFIKDNGLEYEYYAVTPHFSVFMIGETIPITVTSVSSSRSYGRRIVKNITANKTNEVSNNSNELPLEEDNGLPIENKPKENNLWLLIIPVGLIIILIYLLIKRKIE